MQDSPDSVALHRNKKKKNEPWIAGAGRLYLRPKTSSVKHTTQSDVWFFFQVVFLVRDQLLIQISSWVTLSGGDRERAWRQCRHGFFFFDFLLPIISVCLVSCLIGIDLVLLWDRYIVKSTQHKPIIGAEACHSFKLACVIVMPHCHRPDEMCVSLLS